MRVYLSAPGGVDVSAFRDVLARLGAEIVPPTGGEHWQTLETWEGVDAAVVVLMPLSRADDERLFMEAGIALGRQIPLIVFTEHEISPVAFQMTEIVQIRATRMNSESLWFHLSLFLKRLSTSGERSNPSPPERPPRFDVRPFRERLVDIRRLPSQSKSRDYEEWVADLLKSAGAEIAAPTDSQRRGFDLVASVPALDSKIGPLVVEVKRSSSPEVLTDAALGLQYLVLQERAGFGLLLYEDEDLPRSFALHSVPMVLSLGFDELLSELEHEALTDVVLRARNKAVHGR